MRATAPNFWIGVDGIDVLPEPTQRGSLEERPWACMTGKIAWEAK